MSDLVQRMGFYSEMVRTNTFTRSALAVAFCLLYRHLNGRTGRCDPAIGTLAEETGRTARGVQKAIAQLERSGWWHVVRGGGRGRTNAYLPQLDAVKGEPQFTRTSIRSICINPCAELKRGMAPTIHLRSSGGPIPLGTLIRTRRNPHG